MTEEEAHQIIIGFNRYFARCSSKVAAAVGITPRRFFKGYERYVKYASEWFATTEGVVPTRPLPLTDFERLLEMLLEARVAPTRSESLSECEVKTLREAYIASVEARKVLRLYNGDLSGRVGSIGQAQGCIERLIDKVAMSKTEVLSSLDDLCIFLNRAIYDERRLGECKVAIRNGCFVYRLLVERPNIFSFNEDGRYVAMLNALTRIRWAAYQTEDHTIERWVDQQLLAIAQDFHDPAVEVMLLQSRVYYEKDGIAAARSMKIYGEKPRTQMRGAAIYCATWLNSACALIRAGAALEQSLPQLGGVTPEAAMHRQLELDQQENDLEGAALTYRALAGHLASAFRLKEASELQWLGVEFLKRMPGSAAYAALSLEEAAAEIDYQEFRSDPSKKYLRDRALDRYETVARHADQNGFSAFSRKVRKTAQIIATPL